MSIRRSVRLSRPFIALWFLALVAMAVIALQPAANRISRLNAAGFVLGLLATVVAFLWPYRRLRMACLGFLGAVALVLALPWSIRTSPEDLRAAYVEHLQSYEGCLYYWGGESRRGIDCSGLLRRGLIDAALHLGIVRLDVGLLRLGVSLWWNDTSAHALGEEHEGLTRRLFDSGDLKTTDHSMLQPGDIAITADGVHAMAYLGKEIWIEADPGKLQVIEVHAPTTTNGWFLHPVRILRWSVLSR